MDKELKDKWVTALRSGKYKQGTESMLHDGKYCCLGVLCDISGKELKSCEMDSMAGFREINNYDNYLWVKEQYPGYMRLTYMNDSGNSFEYIADYIEQNL